MSHSPSPVSDARADVLVLRSLLDTNTPVPFSVLNAIWRWFIDVEIVLPIAEMEFTDESRNAFARDIVTDMADTFARLEAVVDADPEAIADDHPEVDEVNGLWRELAALYAPMINASVTVIPEDMQAVVYPNTAKMIASSAGISIEDAIERLKTDPIARMSLRRSGIDPDRAIREARD